MSYTTKEVIELARKNLNTDEVVEAVGREMFGLDNPGFCIECGAEREGCEPDAREYECWDCGANAVFGASELLMFLA